MAAASPDGGAAANATVSVTMRCRQQLVRALVNEIIVNIDKPAEIVLIIH